jgi:hypothetical protein
LQVNNYNSLYDYNVSTYKLLLFITGNLGQCAIKLFNISRFTLINSYKIFLNDSNRHGCYFFKYYYSNIWIIHDQSLTNLPKSMWKLIFNVIDVIFNLKVLKRKPIKCIWIMAHVNFSKNMFFGQRI